MNRMVFTLAVFVLFFGAFWWYRQEFTSVFEESLVATNFVPADVRTAIASEMRERGAAATYQKIKHILSDSNISRQHAVAHIFGELLYKVDGLMGIGVCDGDFGFGCYHSFFGAAVADNGTEIIDVLDKECLRLYGPLGLGCPHGIGHGLGEYFGSVDIAKQLDWCNKLAWRGRFFGCSGGVFMEYNTPLMDQDDETIISARPFDSNNPYGTCLAVSKQFQPACFLELPAWWNQVLTGGYKEMGQRCNAVVDPENKEACLLGVGYFAGPASGYDSKKTLEICAALGGQNGTLLCRAGASWSFFANPQERERADEICAHDVATMTTLCQQKADLLAYE